MDYVWQGQLLMKIFDYDTDATGNITTVKRVDSEQPTEAITYTLHY